MSNTRDLVRRALIVADDLEHRRYPQTGPIRQLARLATELEAALRAVRPDPEGCPVCGEPVEQTGSGRPRIYCKPACRNRAAKRARNAKVTAA